MVWSSPSLLALPWRYRPLHPVTDSIWTSNLMVRIMLKQSCPSHWWVFTGQGVHCPFKDQLCKLSQACCMNRCHLGWSLQEQNMLHTRTTPGPGAIKNLVSLNCKREKHPQATGPGSFKLCKIQLLNLASTSLLIFISAHNRNLCVTSGFTDCLVYAQYLILIKEKSSYSLEAEHTWAHLTKPTETCGVLACVYLWMSFQTKPNCSGGFKQHKHCYGLVCAVGKRSLRQAGGARRCKHGLMLFTLFHSNVHCAHFSQSHDAWSQSTHHGYRWPFQSRHHKGSCWIMHSCAHNGSLVIPMTFAGSRTLF